MRAGFSHDIARKPTQSMGTASNIPGPMSARDVLALVAVMFLWALCYPLITLGIDLAPHLSFATLRALVAGVALALGACALRRPVPRRWQTWASLAGIGLGTTSLGFLGMFHAAEFVSPGLATMVASSQPLIAAIMARLLLQERLCLAQAVGLILGFLGIVVISFSHLIDPTRQNLAIGLTYVVLAACGVASGNVLMKALGNSVDPLVAMAAQTLFGAVPLAIAALVREQPSTIVWSSIFVASLLGLALLGTATAYWLWFTLLRRIPLSRCNAFTFLTPVIGLALGITFFGENVGVATLAGLLLTVAGILLVERGEAAARMLSSKSR